MNRYLSGLALLFQAVFCISATAAQNLDPFWGKTVESIEVQGLKRIEKDAVLGKLSSKIKNPLQSEFIKRDVQAIFGMGYFDDIEVLADQGSAPQSIKLAFALKERAAVSKLEFEGNERVTTSDLKDVIKVKQWAILDLNQVKADVALIQKHYEEKGFYLAKVSYEVKPGKPGEVELTYKINDYEKVQIKKITFLNNRVFSDRQLKSVFQETREGGFFSFVSGSGNFKDTSFKQDLQRLTYWYLDHGYVKFRYENPVVTVSDDKKWLYLSIYVDEGEQYTMGTTDFGGDLLFTKDELAQELTLNTEDTFSISARNADILKLTEKYQDLGYAFVNVVPKMTMHDGPKTVDIEYDFEKGSLAYFGEITVVGNTKTHDKVIRRELKIHEGELYSGSRLRQSRENVERLGYFAPGEVIFNSQTPKGRLDIVNIEITVKERSTGTITLGAGYGSIQKFFFTTQISEINLFGKGQTISLTAQYSANQQSKSFNLGFTDPYAFDTRWSAGFDLYSITLPIPNKYLTRKLGFDIRLGHPLAEYIYGFITYKNESLHISEIAAGVDNASVEADRGVLSSVEFSAVRDLRNNRFETTSGNYQRAATEFAGLSGDKKFVKWSLNNRFYTKVVGDLVFKNSTETGRIMPLAGRPVPPSEKFYLGGPNNMKGYDLFLLGPTRRILIDNQGFTALEPLGGTFQAFSLFELEFPLIREAGIKFVTFFDAGNSWESVPGLNELVIRTDVGLGLRWFSPIGPLRFEWGFPLARKPDESNTVFNFFIGPPF